MYAGFYLVFKVVLGSIVEEENIPHNSNCVGCPRA